MKIKQLLESASVGGMSTASVATAPGKVGKMQKRQGNLFAEEMGTELQVWDVRIMNNFYSGKYPDYSVRLYSVVAGSEDEARQVIINNADYVLQDLLSKKLQNGKRILPRSSALPIEEKRVGKASPGTITTMGLKKMLTPSGPQMLKFASGKIVGSDNEQSVAEGKVNELSKGTLSNYSDKADMDIVKKHRNRSGQAGAGDKAAVAKTDKHIDKRMKGIDSANSRLNKGVAEAEKTMSRAAKGNEKYGKDGMKALAKAGREGASEKKLDAIRDRHDNYNEDSDPCWKDYKQIGMKKKGDKSVPNCVPKESVAEVAPPGDKAERMVKHIKKGYAKDGKITPKEKSIAYATAWKAHNVGKVEEQSVEENKKGVRAVKHAVKPRNFVAKNAVQSGAGAHKDKKKAQKQGDVKHKNKDLAYESKLQAALDRKIIR